MQRIHPMNASGRLQCPWPQALLRQGHLARPSSALLAPSIKRRQQLPQRRIVMFSRYPDTKAAPRQRQAQIITLSRCPQEGPSADTASATGGCSLQHCAAATQPKVAQGAADGRAEADLCR